MAANVVPPSSYSTFFQGQGDAFLRDLAVTPVLPLPIGSILDFKVEKSAETLAYPTQNVMEEAGGVVGLKVSGSFKVGATYAAQLKRFVPGTTSTSGMEIVGAETKAHTSGALTLTSVTGFKNTLAVFDSYNRLMTPVASGPTASTATTPGTYVDAGNGSYTFNTTQPGQPTIKYLYTDSTKGFTNSLANATAGGQVATVELVLDYNARGGADRTYRLPAIVIKKVSLSTAPKKNAEYDVEFDAYPDSSGNVDYDSMQQ
jgi:hypothetical protein